MSKTIEIVVSPTGQTHLQTKGFVGGECRQASRFLERALGKRIGEELTAEFHQQASLPQSQQQNNQQQSHQQHP